MTALSLSPPLSPPQMAFQHCDRAWAAPEYVQNLGECRVVSSEALAMGVKAGMDQIGRAHV